MSVRKSTRGRHWSRHLESRRGRGDGAASIAWGLTTCLAQVFATIADNAGVLDDGFTKEAFLSSLHDWEQAVKPAYTEHKVALGYGVYGTPKHVIDETLVLDAESAWGAAEWAVKLESL